MRVRTAHIMRLPMSLGLLLCAASARAIPLHVGTSWKWQVVNHGADAPRFVEATVVDSVATDSGTIWGLSTTDTTGKLQILQTASGEQGWLVGSRALPWEPSPFAANRSKRFQAWGLQAWRTAFQERKSFYGTAKELAASADLVSYNATAPNCVWSDAFGVERFRFRDVDWRLVAFNGRPVGVSRDSLVIPDSGRVFEWDYSDEVSFSGRAGGMPYSSKTVKKLRLRWELLGWARDSADWSIVKLRASATSDSGSSDSVIDLRINRTTRKRLPADRLSGQSPDAAWWKDWTEYDGDQGTIRSHSEGEDGITWWNKSNWSMVISRGERSMLAYANVVDNHSPYTGSDVTTVTYVQVSPSRLPVTRRVGGDRRGMTVSKLAREFPDLVVRWVDTQGRSGSLRAQELGGESALVGRTPKHLFATLPDGTRWSGTTLEFATR